MLPLRRQLIDIACPPPCARNKNNRRASPAHQIGLLHMTQEFLIEAVRKRLQTLGHLGRVSILGIQILNDFRIRFLPQPEIIVRDGFAVANFLMFDFRCNRPVFAPGKEFP